MSEIGDTLFRYLALLQLIPRHPGRITTPTLQEKWKERGFHVSDRSLQRDLRDKLAIHFPLACDDSKTPYRWYSDRDFYCRHWTPPAPLPWCWRKSTLEACSPPS